jgi:2-amino-4-hydroxy-6-hydroxymethyldihydropteridine diphosphokinase
LLKQVFIGIGSNLGDRFENIQTAIKKIGEFERTKVLRVSPFYETIPVGFESVNLFLNGVIEIETDLIPSLLLEKLLLIEIKLGRTREVNQGYFDRPIDLDILIYDDLILKSEELIIPHPEISKRLFVLTPLRDLCPNLIIPELNKNINELYLKAVNDKSNQDKHLRIIEIV